MNFLLALTLSFMASGHCAGMCGGLVGAFNHNSQALRTPAQNQLHLISLNAGRISTYTMAGLLLGWLGASSGILFEIPQWSTWLRKLMALVMIVVGLQLLLRQESGFRLLEHGLQPLWQRIQPIMRRLLPARTPVASYQLGLLWGLLPCGLVYSVLLAATASGSPWQGLFTMLGFGLGTLPALLLTGNAFWLFKNLVQKKQFKQVGGLTISLSGLMLLLAPALITHHSIATHPIFGNLARCFI